MQFQSLGREDPLEEGMAAHSSILAWRIPGQRSLVATARELTDSDTTECAGTLLGSVWSTLPAAGRGVSQELAEVRLTLLPHTTRLPLTHLSLTHAFIIASPHSLTHSTNIS